MGERPDEALRDRADRGAEPRAAAAAARREPARPHARAVRAHGRRLHEPRGGRPAVRGGAGRRLSVARPDRLRTTGRLLGLPHRSRRSHARAVLRPRSRPDGGAGRARVTRAASSRRVRVRPFAAASDVTAVAALWDDAFPESRPWNAPRAVIARKRAL